MHELSMMRDLVQKAETVVRDCGGLGASAVTVRRGALSHMSTAHLQQHFEWVVHGTLLDGAELLEQFPLLVEAAKREGVSDEELAASAKAVTSINPHRRAPHSAENCP